jgi:proteasome lid subunit RPN8/RPN11
MTRHRLTIPQAVFDPLRSHLLRGPREEVALLFAHGAGLPGAASLIVKRWEPVPTEVLVEQAEDVFSVDSSFIVSRVKQARAHGESVVMAHSHPGDPRVPRFSPADDRGERELYPLLHARIPGKPHGALVVSPGGATARIRLPDGLCAVVDEVRIVGRRLERMLPETAGGEVDGGEAHARQQLIWGSHGQGLLRGASVAIIGAGGTGSVVAQQLIHLGIGSILVVDNQLVAESNLSRIVGARRSDVERTRKVDIVAHVAAAVDPTITVRTLFGNVADPQILEALKSVDLIFLCTDSHHSRAVVNALAVQYVVPLVDLGFLIDITQDTKRLVSAVGEVRVVVPGGYCLSCAGVLDADRIRAEKASPEERAANPGYFANLDVKDPSVITLNSTIASLAVTVGCDMLVPTMRPVDVLDAYRYNAVKGLVSYAGKERRPTCGVCGSEGRAALGDSLHLPT